MIMPEHWYAVMWQHRSVNWPGRGDSTLSLCPHAGRFRRMLLGSTTAKLLDEAGCPVMTTQHAETIAPRPLEHREWVCAISLTADSERVFRYAAQYAATLHANLSIIHAIPGHPGLPVRLDLEEEVQSAERRETRRRLDELQRVLGSHARTLVAIGPVKGALLEPVRRSRADALMIGRSPEPGTFGRMRDLRNCYEITLPQRIV
jgi:nucleotide-binding universal stress UspA family protein